MASSRVAAKRAGYAERSRGTHISKLNGVVEGPWRAVYTLTVLYISANIAWDRRTRKCIIARSDARGGANCTRIAVIKARGASRARAHTLCKGPRWACGVPIAARSAAIPAEEPRWAHRAHCSGGGSHLRAETPRGAGGAYILPPRPRSLRGRGCTPLARSRPALGSPCPAGTTGRPRRRYRPRQWCRRCRSRRACKMRRRRGRSSQRSMGCTRRCCFRPWWGSPSPRGSSHKPWSPRS